MLEVQHIEAAVAFALERASKLGREYIAKRLPCGAKLAEWPAVDAIGKTLQVELRLGEELLCPLSGLQIGTAGDHGHRMTRCDKSVQQHVEPARGRISERVGWLNRYDDDSHSGRVDHQVCGRAPTKRAETRLSRSDRPRLPCTNRRIRGRPR